MVLFQCPLTKKGVFFPKFRIKETLNYLRIYYIVIYKDNSKYNSVGKCEIHILKRVITSMIALFNM